MSLTLSPTGQISSVVDYYNSTLFDYWFLWTGRDDLAMHFGYYDAFTTSHQQALVRMNEVVAGYAGVSPSDNVLDAGCGYGGSSIWLASRIGCQVTGITVVPNQLERAVDCARAAGVEGKVRFLLKDYGQTGFPDGSFDVVWFVESLCHANEKARVIAEAYRLLKQGGRLVVSDYMPGVSEFDPQQRKMVGIWQAGWAMPNLPGVGEYSRMMMDAGFSTFEHRDITTFILRNRYTVLSRFSTVLAWSRFMPCG